MSGLITTFGSMTPVPRLGRAVIAAAGMAVLLAF
jgi:hypothetical protein